MNRKTQWLQYQYNDWHFRQDRFLEKLGEQSQQLRLIESALVQDDPIEINTKVAELNFELLRYACYSLEKRITEAATQDCAQLIANSVLDVSGGEDSGKQWSDWLSAAPCWSQLAKEQWTVAICTVTDLVVEKMGDAGISLDPTVAKELDSKVAQLTIRDVLPTELFTRVYSEQVSADDGEEES